ncbi:MAG: hypothetical protein V3T72_05180 [Thermoanaerobaculia bacterium]
MALILATPLVAVSVTTWPSSGRGLVRRLSYSLGYTRHLRNVSDVVACFSKTLHDLLVDTFAGEERKDHEALSSIG